MSNYSFSMAIVARKHAVSHVFFFFFFFRVMEDGRWKVTHTGTYIGLMCIIMCPEAVFVAPERRWPLGGPP